MSYYRDLSLFSLFFSLDDRKIQNGHGSLSFFPHLARIEGNSIFSLLNSPYLSLLFFV